MRTRLSSCLLAFLMVLGLAAESWGLDGVSCTEYVKTYNRATSTSAQTFSSGCYYLTTSTFAKGIIISSGATTTIEIDASVAVSSSDSIPGIYVPSGATLNIIGTGSLTVSGGMYAAGIGGAYSAKWSASAGTINIGSSVSLNVVGAPMLQA